MVRKLSERSVPASKIDPAMSSWEYRYPQQRSGRGGMRVDEGAVSVIPPLEVPHTFDVDASCHVTCRSGGRW